MTTGPITTVRTVNRKRIELAAFRHRRRSGDRRPMETGRKVIQGLLPELELE
jgi:hypothetical protein